MKQTRLGRLRSRRSTLSTSLSNETTRMHSGCSQGWKLVRFILYTHMCTFGVVFCARVHYPRAVWPLRWWNKLVHEQLKGSKKSQHVELEAGHN